jgi:hypothetical protein
MTITLAVHEPSAPGLVSVINSTISRMGRTPGMFGTFTNWATSITAGQRANAEAAGAGIMQTIEPYTGANPRTGTSIDPDLIASGALDAQIIAHATALAGSSVPMIIRFAHEMNGNWYVWADTQWTKAQYIAAYRRVVTVMRTVDPSIKHLWCVNNNPPDAPNYAFEGWYPGDAYVDYVGIDAYNWVALKSAPWHTFDYVMGSSYDEMRALTTKPFMVGEMGCNPVGGDQGAWFLDALLTTIPVRMPATVAVFWFDFDNSASGETNWRFDNLLPSHVAFRRAAADPVYGGTVPRADTATVRTPIRGVI